MVRLIIKYNDRHLKTYDLDDPVITVGRLPENTISVANMGFSRRHFSIELGADNSYVVTDLNSLNGTYVNNKRVKSAVLNHGDVIAIGKHSMVFELVDEAAVGGAAKRENTAPQVEVTTETKQHMPDLEAAAAEVERNDATATRSGDAVKNSAISPVLIETNKHVVYKLDKDLISLGSSEDDDIFVSGFMIGDEHIVIERDTQGATIRANKAMGKVKVNGERTKSHRLDHKDRIEIGNSTFRYMENE